ncbi:MAG: hypothetical protein J0H30_00875, partial [Alphaproteobacteria bacterium]|nr:hypothetical protein [Alphaproteobacteria bacterium]
MGGTIEQTAVERRSASRADTKAFTAQVFHVVRVPLARHMTLLLTLLALLFAAISFFIGPSGL